MAPRALVLGSMGFVGRHLLGHLDRAGWSVHGIDVQAGAHDDLRRRLPTLGGSWDLVAHAAAVDPHRAAIDHRPLQVAENLELDAFVYRWLATATVGRLVYLSSSAVYPTALQHGRPTGLQPGGVRLREDDAKVDDYIGAPDGVYGWAKLVGERLAVDARRGGVPVTVVRPFTGYGGDQSPQFPFGAFLARARAHLDPFPIWGDGRQVRDFIHIDDLCQAILTLVEQDVAGPVNLATGTGTTLGDLARLICEVAGYSPELEPSLTAPAGVRWRVGDPSRMLEHYTPTVTLAEGVRRALQEEATSPWLLL